MFFKSLQAAWDGALSLSKSRWLTDLIRPARQKPSARHGVTNFTMKKHIALGLVAGILFLAGCCTTHKTARWEYKTETLYLNANLDPSDLNANAKDGWEFVSATPKPNDPNQGAVVVFKRRIQ